MSLTFDDVKTFLTAGLTAKDYSTANPMVTTEAGRTMPLFNPGPVSLTQLQRLDPGPIVFAQIGNGPGLDTEQMLDGIFVMIRTIGQQGTYVGAETLAQDIDSIMLSLAGNGTMGSTNVLYVTRLGSPALIDFDSASRSHFQCTYTVKAKTGLVT